jgi:hypothetical protein
MSTIKVKAWLDSGANHDSTRWVTFTVDKNDWERMTEEEQKEYAQSYAWEFMDWGFFVEGEE